MNKVNVKELARRGGIAAGIAVLINYILLEFVLLTNIILPFRPVATGPIVTFTILGVAGATAVYGLIAKFRADYRQLFARVAVITLVLSFIPDIALLQVEPSATVSGVIFLMLLHVTTALISIRVLTGQLSLDLLR